MTYWSLRWPTYAGLIHSARDMGQPDGSRSGTGVFRFASSRGPAVELCIDPIDYHTGLANTIERAELLGIFKALHVDDSGY